MFLNRTPVDPPALNVADLTSRIDAALEQKWMNANEHQKFMTQLQDEGEITNYQMLEEIDYELRLIEAKHSPRASSSASSGSSRRRRSIINAHTTSNTLNRWMAQPKEEEEESEKLESPKVEEEMPVKRVSPFVKAELDQAKVIDDLRRLSNHVSDEDLSELFVETCFFARLGFLQPPSCLRCMYRQGIQNGPILPECPRFTMWRKDANQLLEANSSFGENLVVVRCGAAQQLMQSTKTSMAIDGWEWNPAARKFSKGANRGTNTSSEVGVGSEVERLRPELAVA